MQHLQFQYEETLKAERVTEAEAQQIVHLWAENQKQAATNAGPTVHDIAEGLEIPPEEAHRLLQQVRQKQVIQVEQKVQTRSRTALFVAAFVMAVIAVALMGMMVTFKPSAPMRMLPPPEAVTQPLTPSPPAAGLPR